MEVPVGFEPTNGGFADRSVSHFTTAPYLSMTFLSYLIQKSKTIHNSSLFCYTPFTL